MTRKARGRLAAAFYKSELVGRLVAKFTQSDLLRYSDRRGELADALDAAGFPAAAALCRSARPVAVSDTGELFDPLAVLMGHPGMAELTAAFAGAVRQPADALRVFVTPPTDPQSGGKANPGPG